jgi:nicotinate-nucleotide pyrophosphorylase (carboxylating)
MPTPQNLSAMRDDARRTGLVRRLFELARDEDLGTLGDITSRATIPEGLRGCFDLTPREPAVLSGLGFLPDLLEAFGGGVEAVVHAEDGARATPGRPVATLAGPVRSVLTVERTLLNLVCRLSGIATRTARFIEAARAGVPVGGRTPEVCDTRKTTPGLRVFEKYAVRCGGGCSHRMGLFDAVLIKDNHLAHVPAASLAGAVSAAVARAQDLRPAGLSFIEVEVDTLDQLRALLAAGGAGARIILLDNMTPAQLAEAVAERDRSGCPVLLEASGGVRLETIGAIAASGVDRVSVGSLTHGAVSVDFGLDAAAP